MGQRADGGSVRLPPEQRGLLLCRPEQRHERAGRGHEWRSRGVRNHQRTGSCPDRQRFLLRPGQRQHQEADHQWRGLHD